MTEHPSAPALKLAIAISLLLLAKFAAMAWFVTPLWDIPDESGHYSSVDEVARGSLPQLGKSQVSIEVVRSWIGPNAKPKPRSNWIAQHPPLFYALDAPVLLAARAMGLDFEQQVRAARLPAALFGALTILGLFLFLSRATGQPALGLAGGLFLAATPMFTHLSTGVSHDTLVACTATWGAYWCLRWLEDGRERHLMYAALLVAACTATKITGLTMAVPLYFAIAWRLWTMRTPGTGLVPWALRAGRVWLVMFLPACLWLARNLYLHGHPFAYASLVANKPRVDVDFFHLMLNFPLWEHTILNFIALVGWNGTGSGNLIWIQANGALARYFLALFGAASVAGALLPLSRRLGSHRLGLAVLGLAALALAAIYLREPVHRLALWTMVALLAGMVGTAMLHARRFLAGERQAWLLVTAVACTLFLAFSYYEFLWSAFAGSMRATHGRYFYPIVPFLLLFLAWPFRAAAAARGALFACVVAMVFADVFFLRQVMPMYGVLP